MAIDEELVKILACPDTKEPVALAPAALVERVNERIRSGALENAGGRKVTEPIDAGLLRSDGKILYPVRDDIPVMLVEEGIPVENLS